MKYTIVGPRRVCGFEPGATVEAADLVDANVAHLIASGHIAPKTTAQSKKASTDDGAAVEETEQ